MNKLFNLTLTAALLCGLSLASRLHHTPKEPWVVMDEQPFNDNPLLKESMIWEGNR